MIEKKDSWATCGSGEDESNASLYSTRKWKSPMSRTKEALTCAAKYCNSVCAPFYIERLSYKE